MTDKTQRSEGLLALLMTVLKKSADTPTDIQLLATSVKVLAEQLAIVSKHITRIGAASRQHTVAIDQLLATQEFILRKMKTSSIDADLPDIEQNKSQKPN